MYFCFISKINFESNLPRDPNGRILNIVGNSTCFDERNDVFGPYKPSFRRIKSYKNVCCMCQRFTQNPDGTPMVMYLSLFSVASDLSVCSPVIKCTLNLDGYGIP